MKICKKLLLATALGLTSLSLLGCKTSSEVRVQYVEVPTPVYPPEELLRECKIKAPGVRTTGDLADAYVKSWAALERCDADKAALREWWRSVRDQSKHHDKSKRT